MPEAVGIRGGTEGFARGLTWHLPVVSLDGVMSAPEQPRWRRSDLVRLSERQVEASEQFEETAEIADGDVAVVRGEIYRKHQNALEIDTSIEYTVSHRGSDIGFGSVDLFWEEEQRLRDMSMSRFWFSIFESDQDRCRSSLELLRVNGQIDRVTPTLLRVLMQSRFLDLVGLQRTLDIAQAKVGLQPPAILAEAHRLLSLISAEGVRGGSQDLAAELDAALAQVSPVVDLSDFVSRKSVDFVVPRIVREAEKSVKQEAATLVRARGIRRGQVVQPLPLALLAHLHGHEPDLGKIQLDRRDSPAAGALERSGLLDLIQSGQPGTQTRFALSHIQVRKTTKLFHVLDFHRAPERTYTQQLLDTELPKWLRGSCSSLTDGQRSRVARVVTRLLDNVRAHAQLTRAGGSRSGFYLSVTEGGGDDSINRLMVVVFDNGIGIRGTLERRTDLSDYSTEDLIRWIFLDESMPASFDLSQADVGTGFSESLATLKRFEDAVQGGAKPARAHATLITSTRIAGATELVVAELLDQDPKTHVLPSPVDATGTTILLQLPLPQDEVVPLDDSAFGPMDTGAVLQGIREPVDS